MLKIFGAAGSGSIPIEAMLTLMQVPLRSDRGRHLGQRRGLASRWRRSIRCARCPPGARWAAQVMTESAAILMIYPRRSLSLRARLRRALRDPALRGPCLRWMTYVSAAIYALGLDRR